MQSGVGARACIVVGEVRHAASAATSDFSSSRVRASDGLARCFLIMRTLEVACAISKIEVGSQPGIGLFLFAVSKIFAGTLRAAITYWRFWNGGGGCRAGAHSVTEGYCHRASVINCYRNLVQVYFSWIPLASSSSSGCAATCSVAGSACCGGRHMRLGASRRAAHAEALPNSFKCGPTLPNCLNQRNNGIPFLKPSLFLRSSHGAIFHRAHY